MSWSQDYWDALAEAEQVGVKESTPRIYKVPPGQWHLPLEKWGDKKKRRAQAAEKGER